MVDFGPRCAPPPQIGSRHDRPPRRRRHGTRPIAPGKWSAGRASGVSRLTPDRIFFKNRPISRRPGLLSKEILMPVAIRPLQQVFAGEVAGVDCRRPLSPAEVAAIE